MENLYKMIRRKGTGRGKKPFRVHVSYWCGHDHPTLKEAMTCATVLLFKHHGKNPAAWVADKGCGAYADSEPVQ